MQKIYAVYLGGKADRSNIELHDVVFVIGSSIEETYPLLAKKWFGNMNHFHIDSYLHLQYIDGHEIELSKTAGAATKKLFFINLGAYKPHEFTEYHQNGFYVAENAPEAVRRAKSEMLLGLQTVHKDDVIQLDKLDFEADDILEIDLVDGYHVILKPCDPSLKSLPVSAYIRLDTILGL